MKKNGESDIFQELDELSKACETKGISRETFYANRHALNPSSEESSLNSTNKDKQLA